MKTEEENAVTSGPLADLEAVLEHIDKGGVKDPQLLLLIEARSRAIRQRVLAEHGVLDAAVDLVRETRDE